jgi:hypothetical protein
MRKAVRRKIGSKFLGHTPSARANQVEWADFLEIQCLFQSDRNASSGDLLAALSRIDDDILEERGRVDGRFDGLVFDTFTELRARSEHCGRGVYKYPFRVDEEGQFIELRSRRGQRELYLFLLLATRMNMNVDRVQNGIDATHLFEQICCEVAKGYWGERAEALVFGTARRTETDEVGRFPDAVDNLCSRLGEGTRFYCHSGHQPSAKDGNLDIVVWKRFTDQRNGHLIGFGQCKTGTHFDNGIFELQPQGFCKKWMLTSPTATPVRLFFTTARPTNKNWFDLCVDAGIVFDRCRMLDFAPRMPELKPLWQAWLNGALEDNGIHPL